jgi:hypothetical protein
VGIVHRDRQSVAGEPPRDLAAEPARTAGHESDALPRLTIDVTAISLAGAPVVTG